MDYDYKILEVKIDHIEREMSDMKEELKGQREVLNSTIVSMSNNLAKLTTLSENQAKQLEKQDARLEKQDEALSNIGKEISYLRVKIDDNKSREDASNNKFLQTLVKDNWKAMLLVLFLLLCFFTGYKIVDIAGLIG